MKVALFSGGENDPASRFRYRQNIPLLEKYGIKVKDYQAYLSQYAGKNKLRRPVWAINELYHRYNQIRDSKSADISIIQREFLASLSTLEGMVKHPKIFDFDDAIYLRQRFGGVDKIIKRVDAVFCGNSVLAEYAEKYNKNIYIVNTPVDINRFIPVNKKYSNQIIIGWSGTAANYQSLYSIEDSLAKVLNSHKNIKLLISSNEPPKFKILSENKFDFIKWSPSNEVKVIQTMDIGIMPLEDTLWNRGKCAYKMLLYMACGIPVVVSPIGMNADVLNLSAVGYGAKTNDDWVDALFTLVMNENLRVELGLNGRKTVVKYYSNDVISKKIAGYIKDVYQNAHK